MKKIVCYGEGLIDFTYDGQAFIPHPGGSPYNVAIALGRLNIPTEYCTKLSNDMFGDMLIKHLQNNKVGITAIKRDSAPSTLAFVLTTPDSEPEYAFYSNGAADVILSKQDLPSSIEAGIHHFGSISLMQEPCGSIWQAYLTQLDGFISFDPNIRPSLIRDRNQYMQRFESIATHTNLLRLSLADLAWLYPNEDMDTFIKRMFSYNVEMVAVTAGSGGAWIYTQTLMAHHPIMPITVADTIGAGDTFTAGLLSVLIDHIKGNHLNNMTQSVLEHAIKVATIAAALNCQNKGANPPTAEAVAKLI